VERTGVEDTDGSSVLEISLTWMSLSSDGLVSTCCEEEDGLSTPTLCADEGLGGRAGGGEGGDPPGRSGVVEQGSAAAGSADIFGGV